MFKTHIWGLIETNTSAIYHAAASTLQQSTCYRPLLSTNSTCPLMKRSLSTMLSPFASVATLQCLAYYLKNAHGTCHLDFRVMFPPSPTTRVERYQPSTFSFSTLSSSTARRTQALRDRGPRRNAFSPGLLTFERAALSNSANVTAPKCYPPELQRSEVCEKSVRAHRIVVVSLRCSLARWAIFCFCH